MNKALELQEAKARIEANLSNYITEIARIHGVSKKEAQRILEENIKINQAVFEATKNMKEKGHLLQLVNSAKEDKEDQDQDKHKEEEDD